MDYLREQKTLIDLHVDDRLMLFSCYSLGGSEENFLSQQINCHVRYILPVQHTLDT